MAPLHFDDAVAAALHHIAQVGAIGAVYADTFAARDKAAYHVGRRGLAAFGQLRHQRIHAHYQHAAFARGRSAWFLKMNDIVRIRRGFGRA